MIGTEVLHSKTLLRVNYRSARACGYPAHLALMVARLNTSKARVTELVPVKEDVLAARAVARMKTIIRKSVIPVGRDVWQAIYSLTRHANQIAENKL